MGWPQVRGGVGSLASVFSNAIVNLIKVEETLGIPSGKILVSLGNKVSSTHLYGAMDIYKWVKKHPYKRLIKAGKKTSNQEHLNPITMEYQ
jgi:hypothetical protein